MNSKEHSIRIEETPEIKTVKKMLFKTLNCCEAQVITLQRINNAPNDELLKSLAGLAGGVNNHGSTCGVLFGVAINMASKLAKDKPQWELFDEVTLLYAVRDYVGWFQKIFDSTLCRDRTGLDLKSKKGKIGLLSPKKAKGCIKQSVLSMDYFLKHESQKIFETEFSKCGTRHCARELLEKTRKSHGVGNQYLEQISVIFDGGLGLSGNTCGALIAGLLALGLKYRQSYNYHVAAKLRNYFKSFPPEFTKRADLLIKNFENKFGSLECKQILGQEFRDWCDFQEKRSSKKCEEVLDFVEKQLETFLME